MSHRNSRIFQGPRYWEMPRLYDVHVLFWSIKQHSQALGLPAGMNFAARPSSTKLLVGAVVSPRMNLPFGSIWDSLFHPFMVKLLVYYWFHLWFKHCSNQLRDGTGTGECLGKGEATAQGYPQKISKNDGPMKNGLTGTQPHQPCNLSVILGQVQPSRFRLIMLIQVEPGFEHLSLSANQLHEHWNETLTLGFRFNDFIAG